MFFVHVIAGLYTIIFFPQFNCQSGSHFTLKLKRFFIETRDQKNFSIYFIYKRIRSEGKSFFNTWFIQAIFTKCFNIHFQMILKCQKSLLRQYSGGFDLY